VPNPRTTIEISAVDKTDNAISSAKRSLEGLSADASRLGLALTSALSFTAVAGAAVAFGTSTRAIIDQADALNDLSSRTGVAVEELSKFAYVAKLDDTSLESLQRGIKTLATNMAEAAAGTGTAGDAFKAIGVAVTDASGALRPVDEVLKDIAEKFAGYNDGAGKSAIATKFFAKAGQDLIPFLNEGRDGLKEMGDEAEKLGVVIGDRLAKNAAAFNDNMDKLAASSKAFAISIAGPVAEALTKFTDKILAAKLAGQGFLGSLFTAVTDGEDPATKIQGINSRLEKLKTLVQELPNKKTNISRDVLTNSYNKEIESLQKQLEYYTELKRLQGKSLGTDQAVAAAAARVDGKQNKKKDAPNPNAGPDDKEQKDAVEKFFAKLILKSNEELYKQAEALRNLNDPLKKYYDQLQEIQILQQLGAISPEFATQITAKTQQDILEAVKKMEEASEAENKKLQEKAERYRELADPLRKYALQIEEIQQLERLNVLGAEESEAAQAKVVKQMEEAAKKANDTNDLAKELGLTFSSAFEDAIVKGEGFRDVLKGIASDILRIAARKTITEPIAKSVGNIFNGIDFGNIFGFAKGGTLAQGVYDSPTMFKFANGGALGMLAEAGRSEAVLPLARTAGGDLGVQVAGGGGNSAVPVIYQTIDARGAQPGTAEIVRLAAQQGAEAGYAKVMRELARGGPAARAVGLA